MLYRTTTWRDWIVLFVEHTHKKAPQLGGCRADQSRRILFFRIEDKDTVKVRLGLP